MENGMSLSDYAALEKLGNRHRGVANSALGLGIAGLAVGLIGVWGLNKISESRSRAAEKIAEYGSLRTNDLYSLVATERASREAWQSQNQPTLSQVIELQNNPSLQSTVQDIVSAMATATATANNNGINSAIGGDHFLRVQRYSAPMPCGCDSCQG